MAEFAVPVVALDDVHPHPDPEVHSLDIGMVGDFQCIIPRGRYKTGDLAIYIPENAIVPEWLLEEIGLKGKLSGKARNRVKASKFKGVLSQGLVVPFQLQGMNTVLEETTHDDISGLLGIEKYEPTIPTHMAGVVGSLYGYTKSFDFENIKRHPKLFDDSDYVMLTEKIHGTFVQVGWLGDLPEPRDDLFGDGRVFVTSKGLAKRGEYIKNTPENEHNLYAKIARECGLIDIVQRMASDVFGNPVSDGETPGRVYVMGEIYGDVQDLKYGKAKGSQDFVLFDVTTFAVGRYFHMSANSLPAIARNYGMTPVPLIAEGHWFDIRDNLNEYTSGMSTLDPTQIREGVVIRTASEQVHPRYGRKIAKSVSEAYLLRKGNVTEYA